MFPSSSSSSSSMNLELGSKEQDSGVSDVYTIGLDESSYNSLNFRLTSVNPYTTSSDWDISANEVTIANLTNSIPGTTIKFLSQFNDVVNSSSVVIEALTTNLCVWTLLPKQVHY